MWVSQWPILSDIFQNPLEFFNVHSTMDSEILQLNILEEQDYLKIMDRFIKGMDLTTRTCHLLITILEAGDVIINSSGGMGNNPLINTYLELFQGCIVQLEKITVRYRYVDVHLHPVSAVHVNSALDLNESSKSFSTCEKVCLVTKVECNCTHKAVSSTSDCNKEPALSENYEVAFIRKLTWLTVLLYQKLEDMRKSLLQNCPENGLQNIIKQNHQLLKNVVEEISWNITLNTVCPVMQEHDRIKALALIYATLLEDGGGLMQNEVLRESFSLVVLNSLDVIETCDDNDLLALVLSLIVRPYLETRRGSTGKVMQKLWQLVMKFYVLNQDFVVEEKNKLGFMIMCFMAEYMFEDGIFDQIGIGKVFWQIIQFGLIHTNSQSRKRSQYILKRCVDHFTSNQPSEQHISEYLPWPEGKKKEMLKLWHTFFLLTETLEEKQSHVLKPVLKKMNGLITSSCHRNGESVFHPSWLLVIFKRLFDHDNKNIRQQGLKMFLEEKWPVEVLSKEFLFFTTTHLLTALSDYALYGRDSDQQSEVAASMGDKIAVYITNATSSLHSECTFFLSSLLEAIFDRKSWGGIPLFYLTRGLALAPSSAVWRYETVKQAVLNFEHCLSTQEVVLRSASQCDLIRAILIHLSPDTSFLQLCDIIGRFRRKESWCRGTVIWYTIVTALGDCFGTWNEKLASLQNVITSFLSTSNFYFPNDIALGICLLMDGTINQLKEEDGLKELLIPLNNFLRDCHIRPYLDVKKLSWILEVLTQVLEILYDVPRVLSRELTENEDLFACLTEGLDCVVQLFIQQVIKCREPHDTDVVLLHLNFFSKCYSLMPLKSVMFRHYPEILLVCKSLLSQEILVQVFFGILLLEHLLKNYQHYKNPLEEVRRELIFLASQKVVNNIETLTQRRHVDGYESSEFTKKLLMEMTRSCWSCVQLLVDKSTSWEESMGDELAVEVRTHIGSVLIGAIPTASRLNVHHVFRVAVSLASSLIECCVWEGVVSAMWGACEDFRKSCDLHRYLVSCLTRLLYHPDAFLAHHHHSFIIQISQQMLVAAESVQGISTHMALCLSTALVKIHSRGHLDPASLSGLVQEVLVPLVMFGSVYRKQYRVIRDTVVFIRACSKQYSTDMLVESDWDSESKTRAMVIRYLLTLSKTDKKQCAMAQVVADGIRHHYARSGGDRRDYANSQNHRYKTRLLQALLILLPLLEQGDCEEVLRWLGHGIICEHQQPSVRYLQEWGAALVAILHPHLYTTLMQQFRQGTRERVGCVGSFLAAVTHVACCSTAPQLLCEAIQHTLPWCMAQHFNTRLYAQVSLRKIWQHCKTKGVTEVLDKYHAVQECLQFVAEQGNAARNATNMLNDFYFKVFHPIDHFTLQTILHDLPCLSLVASEEWISVGYLLGVVTDGELPMASCIPLFNKDSTLATAPPAPWVVKAAGETRPCEEEDEDERQGEMNDVQRKITPWKFMVPEITLGLGLPQETKLQQKRSGLILVASLIDKAANLGGLCRTCEVFRVRQMVVDTLAVKDDHTFAALSLTAHHWLPMKEVKVDELGSYLRGLRAEGYTLVGAEQTANSTSLAHFQFPERSVVLLGNERKGIPCEFLQLLDVCVEIPQSGVIRSLNVHVSGALFIWEYTRQHPPTTSHQNTPPST